MRGPEFYLKAGEVVLQVLEKEAPTLTREAVNLVGIAGHNAAQQISEIASTLAKDLPAGFPKISFESEASATQKQPRNWTQLLSDIETSGQVEGRGWWRNAFKTVTHPEEIEMLTDRLSSGEYSLRRSHDVQVDFERTVPKNMRKTWEEAFGKSDSKIGYPCANETFEDEH
jgi:hypothetical protein